MIQPTHDNLLVKINKVEEQKEKKTASGLILTAKNEMPEKESIGIVEAIGQGRYLPSGTLIPSCANVGDKVIFNKFAGTEIVDEDITYLLLKENDILAIIK